MCCWINVLIDLFVQSSMKLYYHCCFQTYTHQLLTIHQIRSVHICECAASVGEFPVAPVMFVRTESIGIFSALFAPCDTPVYCLRVDAIIWKTYQSAATSFRFILPSHITDTSIIEALSDWMFIISSKLITLKILRLFCLAYRFKFINDSAYIYTFSTEWMLMNKSYRCIIFVMSYSTGLIFHAKDAWLSHYY